MAGIDGPLYKKSSFEKMFEYFSALTLISFGLSLSHSDPTFSLPSYNGFVQLGFSEAGLAALALSFGLVWLVALWINGRWRRSPALRAGCAVLGSGLWGMVAGSFLSSTLHGGIVTTAPGTYFLIAIFSVFAASKAAADAVHA